MDSNLQNKLQNFTTSPPEEVWNKISDALGTEERFPTQLYHYEEQPPSSIWLKIEKDLKEEKSVPAKVVPFTTRFRRSIRYTAVACFIAVILVTITLNVKRTEAGSIEANSNTTVPSSSSTATTNLPEQKKGPLTEINDSKAHERSQQTAPQTSTHVKENNPIDAAENEHPVQRKNANVSYASLSKYVLFNDGDGKLRKVSKKMADFVNCKDSDDGCKQRLQQLRQKMAANAMTTDFTGVLEMLRQLQ